MKKEKALGLDGFQVGFLQENWEIVGSDLVEEVAEFFKRGKILKSWNDTFLALAPK